jgi:hypothetical protein
LDDLNVAGALAALFVFMNEVNRELDRVAETAGPEAGVDTPVPGLADARGLLDEMDQVLGLLELGRKGRSVDDDLAAWVEGGSPIASRPGRRATGPRPTRSVTNWPLGIVLEDSEPAARAGSGPGTAVDMPDTQEYYSRLCSR